jgi:hypothetical protein
MHGSREESPVSTASRNEPKARYPDFDEYPKRTDREIPVVVLGPR